MKFIEGSRNWRSILGTQLSFWPLTPPPPSKGHGYHSAVPCCLDLKSLHEAAGMYARRGEGGGVLAGGVGAGMQ